MGNIYCEGIKIFLEKIDTTNNEISNHYLPRESPQNRAKLALKKITFV